MNEKKTKTYTAIFWRGNPQLQNGGYETKRTFECANKREANKKLKEIEKHTVYGTMDFLRWEGEAK